MDLKIDSIEKKENNLMKKPFNQLTPAGQKKRITAIEKELASKNLRQELVQIVSIKRNGKQLPPKVTPVVKDGQELGNNVLFRVRRADFKWSMVNGVKTIVPFGDGLKEGEEKVFGNAYHFVPAGNEGLLNFYANLKPGVYFNATTRTDRIPTDKKGNEQPADIFVYKMFVVKSEKLNKVNPYAHLDVQEEEVHDEIEVEHTPVVDNAEISIDDLPF